MTKTAGSLSVLEHHALLVKSLDNYIRLHSVDIRTSIFLYSIAFVLSRHLIRLYDVCLALVREI